MTVPRTDAGRGRPAPPGGGLIPFPAVDEVSRHCLSGDEPESVHLEVHLPGRLDPARLREAFRQALLAHPRVLVREVPGRGHRRSYAWEPTGEPDGDPVAFAGRGPGALARARTRALADCPPLTVSPPMRLDVVEAAGEAAVPEPPADAGRAGSGTGTVLLLTAHHTALDAPSALRVLATTAERYSGTPALPIPGRVRPDRPDPAPGGTGGTGRTLRTRPVRVAPDARPASVRARAAGNGMLQADLPVPRRAAPAGSPPPWTVNDQLLTAAALTVGRWNVSRGRPPGPVRITMPVDDRPRGTEMPMGNGTRLVEVAMAAEDPRDTDLLLGERPDPAAVARLLRTTARRTRALKATRGSLWGAGAGLLTVPLLPVGIRGVLTRGARRATAPWTSTVLVTNLGRVPYGLDFGDAGRATAVWFSAPARMPRGLSVAAASTGGRLHVTLRWSRALLGDAAGADLAGLFGEALSAVSLAPAPQLAPAPSPAPVPSDDPEAGPDATAGSADADADGVGVGAGAGVGVGDAETGARAPRGRARGPGGPHRPDTPRPDTAPGAAHPTRDHRERPS
ncbi:condensation protein [Streptomyces fradiae]|uniref:condensation protein n=1 Tax=Streptomyces fradiae TaxID=1906 RepID=UPI0029420C5C|nr:condensation protein [Streptomyces fradiae]WOI60507.1 condensation protein [Streptomyces fradiae]